MDRDTTLRMADGRRLHVHDWPVAAPRAGVLLVHGLGEHGARYAGLARWLNARGLAARSYDQRGHGRSTGARGGLRHATDLLDDLTAVDRDFRSALGAPVLLLGHSMGGLVALRAVLDGRVAPAGLVLASPALRSWAPPWQQRLAARLDRGWPGLPLRSGLRLDRLSHDPAVAAACRRDRLRHGWITPRLAHFIFTAGAACIADATRLAVPTLMLVAGDDRLVDPRGGTDFAARAGAGAPLAFERFDGLYHELFNERPDGRARVLARLGSWLATQGC